MFFFDDFDEEDHDVIEFCQSNFTRSKRSLAADHETNLVLDPVSTLNFYASAVYLGFYFAFIVWIFVHQCTISLTGTTDICAAASLLNTIYFLIGLCPPYTPPPAAANPHQGEEEASLFSRLFAGLNGNLTLQSAWPDFW